MKSSPLTALLLAFIVAGPACNSPKGTANPAASARPDRWADGKQLADQRAKWKQLWEKIPELPTCSGVSEEHEKVCRDAAEARKKLAKLEIDGAPDAEQLDALLRFTVAIIDARNTLQSYGLRWAISNPATSASASAAPPPLLPPGMMPVPPPPIPSVRAATSAKAPPGGKPRFDRSERMKDLEERHAHEGEHAVGEDPNPWAAAVKAYEASLRLAFARWGTYLEFAPLALRRQARERVEKLIDERPNTIELRRLVNEAWITEGDVEQRALLAALRTRIGVGLAIATSASPTPKRLAAPSDSPPPGDSAAPRGSAAP